MDARQWAAFILRPVADDMAPADDEWMRRLAAVGDRLFTEAMTDHDAILLAEYAVGDPAAWDALQAAAGWRLSRAMTMPKAFAEFVALALVGGRPQPKGRPSKAGRDGFIAGVMLALCRAHDLRPTRSGSKGDKADSAASIVAEALNMTEDALAKIWARSEARRYWKATR